MFFPCNCATTTPQFFCQHFTPIFTSQFPLNLYVVTNYNVTHLSQPLQLNSCFDISFCMFLSVHHNIFLLAHSISTSDLTISISLSDCLRICDASSDLLICSFSITACVMASIAFTYYPKQIDHTRLHRARLAWQRRRRRGSATPSLLSDHLLAMKILTMHLFNTEMPPVRNL